MDAQDIAAELERHIGKLGAPSGDTPSVMRAAAAELRRLTAERDALAAKLTDAEASDEESMSMYRSARDRADALTAKLEAIERAEPVAVPTGWKLVPVEPTQAMCAAAVVFANGNAVYKNVAAEALRIEEAIYGEAYAAMLAAAPQPPEAKQVRQPLTDERIEAEFERMLGPLRDAHDQDRYLAALSWYRRGARFSERARGIGQEGGAA